MAKKIYMNEAFILATDIQNHNADKQELFKKFLIDEGYDFDPHKWLDCIEFSIICDNFTDAAKIETYLQTCGL